MDDDRLLMTPGPTAVPERVRERMAEPSLNPDVEAAFDAFYRDLIGKLAGIYGESVAILGGEGILGLEAAVASLVDEGDRALCVSNGLYGDGFADFVESEGGEAVTCRSPSREPFGLDAIESTLETAAREGEPIEVATMVHCETPTGTLNDLDPVLDLLEKYDVVSVVDAVSSLGGTPVPTDRIDVTIGASQKCFSAPPGLAVLSVSDRAWDRIERTRNRSYYTDLAPWRTAAEEGWFPYTHLTANLQALDEATDLLLEEGLESVFERHVTAAETCRERAREMGVAIYPRDDELASPTVTALHLEGRAVNLQRRVADEHGIVLSTGLGELEDDVLRVGHMGHNARVDRVERTMDAIADVVESV